MTSYQDLKVDNSSLTGESEPQSRNAEVTIYNDRNFREISLTIPGLKGNQPVGIC